MKFSKCTFILSSRKFRLASLCFKVVIPWGLKQSLNVGFVLLVIYQFLFLMPHGIESPRTQYKAISLPNINNVSSYFPQ